MRYVLNSAVVTTPGTYNYRLIDTDEVKRWLDAGPFDCTIAYPETAKALESITGRLFQTNRKTTKMAKGDEALIFRLTARMSRPDLKGKLTPEFVLANSEIGILKKLTDCDGREKNMKPIFCKETCVLNDVKWCKEVKCQTYKTQKALKANVKIKKSDEGGANNASTK